MSHTLLSRAGLLGLSALVVLASAAPAAAQHRARVSRSLQHDIDHRDAKIHLFYQGPQSEVDRIAKQYGLTVAKRLHAGAIFLATSNQADQVASDSNVPALQEDSTVFSTMAVTTQLTGAAQEWSAGPGHSPYGGITGKEVGVAIIDSGVQYNADLLNRISWVVDFTDTCTVFPFNKCGLDEYGHGTHLAGIVAGSGFGSRTFSSPGYVGMAPGANIIVEKVLGKDGSGTVSDVVQAIDWTIANASRYKIKVINLSLGRFPDQSYQDDPMAQAVERAVHAGLVVVTAAGNLGKTPDGKPVVGGIVSPGYDPMAITVGALNTHGTVVRSDDGVTTYSSRGPVGNPNDSSNWLLKPDLVAPGNAIVSTAAVGSYLWNTYPALRVYGPSGGAYMKLSGTSQASAVVSGAVALLLQAAPSLTPGQVKFALQFSAEHLPHFGSSSKALGA